MSFQINIDRLKQTQLYMQEYLKKEFGIENVCVFVNYNEKKVQIRWTKDGRKFCVNSPSERLEVIRGVVRKELEIYTQTHIKLEKLKARRIARIKKVRAIIALRREKKKDKRTNMKNFPRTWKTRIINSSPSKPIFSGFMNLPPGYLPNPSD